jgi:hypothetical protein
MAGSDKHQEQLERLVDELLRDQPLRHAPNTLEAHVFAEIARRAALPWWRKSFTHWPLLARVAFLIASYGFVRLTLLGAMSVVDALRSEPVTQILTPAQTRLHAALSLLSVAREAGDLVVHAIPLPILYGIAAIGVALYVTLFGIGAAAYRTLHTR